MFEEKKMNTLKKDLSFNKIGTIIPAILIGIVGMVGNNVPISISLQNLVATIIFGLMAIVFINKSVRINDEIIIVITLILLLLTLFGNDIDGVQRWIKLGIINVNIAMIVLPITLVASYNLLIKKRVKYALIFIVSIAILLVLQPDASQLMGFSIPIIIILFDKKININSILRYVVSLILILLMILSWIFLDKLAPVSYVEGILGLLNNVSPILMVMGVISLILIPLPFIFFPPKEFRRLSIGIGLYYSLIMLSAIFGNFPVPFMGYGISPIIGYWIVFIWYINMKSFHISVLRPHKS